MSINVNLMQQINRLVEAIRREDEASAIIIPDYSSINTMNTETLIKVRTQLIRQLIRISPSYPVKDLNLGNLQSVRSSSYATDIPLAELPLKEV
jgi:hypothetical protein